MDEPGPKPKVVIADKGYDADAILEDLRQGAPWRSFRQAKSKGSAGDRRLYLHAEKPRRAMLLQAQA